MSGEKKRAWEPGKGICKGCGASILWVPIFGGRPHPFNAIPVRGVVLAGQAGSTVPRQGGVTFAEAFTTSVRVSHFETCPKADDFRAPTGG